MSFTRAFCGTFVVVAGAYSLAIAAHQHPQWSESAGRTSKTVARYAQDNVIHPSVTAGYRELAAFFDAIDPQPLNIARTTPPVTIGHMITMERVKPIGPAALTPLVLPRLGAPPVTVATAAPDSKPIPDQAPARTTVGTLMPSSPPDLLTHGPGGLSTAQRPDFQGPASGPLVASIAPHPQTQASDLWRATSPESESATSLPASTSMPMGLETEAAPAGFISFCSRYPAQCGGAPNDPQKIHLDLAAQKILKSVTVAVNRAIGPEGDLAHYGVAEYWDLPADGYGNCKDYALVKRKQLIAQGLPERALRLAIVIVPTEGRHVVLTVATDKGDFVLDNLNDDVKPWTEVSYRWLERQDPAGELGWVTFTPDLVAAAAPSRAVRPDGPPLLQLAAAQQSARRADVPGQSAAALTTVALAPDDLKHVFDRLKTSLTAEMYDHFELFLYVSKADTGPWAQHMFVFTKSPGGGLALKYTWLVSTGRETLETNRSGARLNTSTPEGYFQLDPQRLYRQHVSSQWGMAMPFAMFFNWTKDWSKTGLAIDAATNDGVAQLGKRATPGSIHLSPDNAATLFGLVKSQYRGQVPKFAFDSRNGTMSNDGLFVHDAAGNLQFTQGYKVLVFIENHGGSENVVAAVF